MPEQAVSSLLDLLSLNPNNAEALYGMAYLKISFPKVYGESRIISIKKETKGFQMISSRIRLKIRGAQESHVTGKIHRDNLIFQILAVIVIFGLIAVLIIVFVPETKNE